MQHIDVRVTKASESDLVMVGVNVSTEEVVDIKLARPDKNGELKFIACLPIELVQSNIDVLKDAITNRDFGFAITMAYKIEEILFGKQEG